MLQNKAVNGALAEIGDEVLRMEDEINHLENKVRNLENTIENRDIQIDKLLEDIAERNEYVLELENALAEAHLMSQDDGPEECDLTKSSSTPTAETLPSS